MENTKRTISGILFSQYLDHIEKRGIMPTIKMILIVIIWLLIVLCWVYPEASSEIIKAAMRMKNYIIPKMIVVFASIFSAPALFFYSRQYIHQLSRQTPHNSIWGVPLVEVVGYLFDNWNFPRDQVCDLFAISRSEHAEIVEVLDAQNILVRGQNNSRVLNPLMPRETVVNILLWGETVKYASMIGKTFDFFAAIREKIQGTLSSIPSPAERRFKLHKI